LETRKYGPKALKEETKRREQFALCDETERVSLILIVGAQRSIQRNIQLAFVLVQKRI
jgi:hypothetical protein